MLGAAMWQQPHILVLDEPTNYLDRESLGAMASAIKEYGGGVVIVSHHHEFVNQVGPQGGSWQGAGVEPQAGGSGEGDGTLVSTAAAPCPVDRVHVALTLPAAPPSPPCDRCALRSGPWVAASARSPASLPRPWRRR